MRVGFLFGLAVALDQITKQIIRHSMGIGDSFNVIGQVVKITYVENPGIAFGIRVGNGTLFTVLSILASLGVMVYLFTHWDEGMGIKGSDDPLLAVMRVHSGEAYFWTMSENMKEAQIPRIKF